MLAFQQLELGAKEKEEKVIPIISIMTYLLPLTEFLQVADWTFIL